MTLRIARTGPDGRLDHQVAARMLVQKLVQRVGRIVPGFDELAGYDRHPLAIQICQIVLVDVPAHQLQRVVDGGRRTRPLQPAQEFAQARGVVPGGSE